MTKLAFEPHRITQQQLHPVKDNIIVSEMNFKERFTQSGIILHSDDGTALGIRPRWGQVYAVGPDQQDVTVGQWVCVAHGRWTRGVEIEDQGGRRTIRKIDPKDVMLISDEPVQDDTMSTAVHEPDQNRWR